MDLKQYFQSYENYFWEWATDEDVPDETGYNENNLIYFTGIGAVAYRPYVIEVLKELKYQGFPPFGSFLMVLFVSNDTHIDLGNFMMNSNVKIEISGVFHFLKNIKELDPIYKKGRNRIIFFFFFFKDCHNIISSGNSELILKRFEKRPDKISDCAIKQPFKNAPVNKDFQTLKLLYQKFPTTESIVEAMKGFNDIPEREDEVKKGKTPFKKKKDYFKK